MKIKLDYVTNSSSTSYLIICDEDFSEEMFYKELGITGEGPIRDFISYLFREIDEGKEEYEVYMEKLGARHPFDFPKSIQDKLDLALSNGSRVYAGSISSEINNQLSYFCTSSFEVETQHIYINYVECFW